jgi:hypothetical protein
MDAAKVTARAIVDQAPSNVDGLITLFERPELPGAAPLARLRWILKLTASDLPGMQMGLFPADDSGFRQELADGRFYQDPRYWATLVSRNGRRTKQMGHFLTAAGLRLNRWPRFVKLNLIIGHEKLGDGVLFAFARQFARATAKDRQRFLAAVDADRAGDPARREARLREIFHTRREALHDPLRIGNSLVDLRLSVKGWRFAEEILRGELASRAAAIAWLRREVYDARRARPRRPSTDAPPAR